MSDGNKKILQPAEILALYQKPVRELFLSKLRSTIFPKQFLIPREYADEERFHWEMVGDYPKRQSKYLRPTLILLVAEAMGTKLEQVLPTAVSMQVSEEWLLIHDDFEDNSSLRRGLPALHHIYSSELAVNAGDFLHLMMWESLRSNIKLLGPDMADRIYQEFFTMLTRTAIGQTTEIRWTQGNKMDLKDEDWFFVCDGKTGYYSIAGPLRLGVILSQGTVPQLEAITQFGLLLGRCFQLVDDLLDVTSDFSGKKQAKNDIFEGKRTLILGHLLRNISGQEKQKIQKILSKPRKNKTETEVLYIYESMVKAGSIEYAKKMAIELRDQAIKILEDDLSFLSKEPARGYLRELTNFILSRDH